MNSRKTVPCLVAALLVLCPLAAIIYAIPPIQDRLVWQYTNWKAQIEYALDPPEKRVFTPNEASGAVTLPPPALAITPLAPSPEQISAETTATDDDYVSIADATANPYGPTETVGSADATETAGPTVTPTPTLAPPPPRASISGVPHAYQGWNNCGPANLAMTLNYWGWEGDQRQPAGWMKPNPRDRNVMPYEMEAYVEEQAGLRAITRVNGQLTTLKRFIAAGFPVIVEKGYEGDTFDGWMGHYQVVTSYDDGAEQFVVQDSYKGPNLKINYEKMQSDWRAFNFLYIVVYPPHREIEVYTLLGQDADERANYLAASQRAEAETQTLSGRDLFFAWYNVGSSQVGLRDYKNAALAFDAAFANYSLIPEKQRPWRMVWYQTGPYWAYFYSYRYNDVVRLANETLDASSEPILEESYYWRGLAEVALGDVESAIADFQKSLKAHPDFTPALEQLAGLGATP